MTGRNDIDIVRHDHLAIFGLAHRQRGLAAQQFGQKAFVMRVKMLHHDIGHPGRQFRRGQHVA